MKANRAIYRTCADCGGEFVISPKFQDFIEENNLKLPKRCKDCRHTRKEVFETRKCLMCEGEFTITHNESKFYAERGLTEPKRCPDCRKKRHERDSEEAE